MENNRQKQRENQPPSDRLTSLPRCGNTQESRLLQQAIENANLIAWTYDIRQQLLTEENENLKNAGFVERETNFPQSQMEDGFIAEDSLADYQSIFQRIWQGEASLTEEIWFCRHRNPKDRRCLRLSYTVFFDEAGQPMQASGLGLDITEEKNRSQMYEKRMELLLKANPNSLGSLQMNLTQNVVSDQKSLYQYIQHQQENLPIEEYIRNMRCRFRVEAEYESYAAMFNREHLLTVYENGENTVALTHRYLFEDAERWITTTGRILCNPTTGDIEVMVYALDATERVLTKQIAQRLVDQEYDIVALIYPDKNWVDFRFANREYDGLHEITISDYEKNRTQAASRLFDASQGKLYLENTNLAVIQHNLNQLGRHVFTNYRMVDGVRRYKNYTYTYLDESNSVILCSVQDVTALYQQEEVQMLAIQQALEEAERANAAKSVFLSNMSHDIRTPMNAIINMTNLALENLDKPDKRSRVRADLNKIETSSRFLLSLINDILDMSKIDSGKMQLRPEVYEYREFREYISSVFEPLCRSKGLRFVWNGGETAMTLYMDKLRFNQIFFNVLSNAVKYTSSGGTVTYGVENNKVKDGVLSCDFIISDTGIGMSEAFQKRMFQPFEREENISAKQTGTGLGLAIAKSTIALMGGTIAVKSELGKGTEFRIHLEMPLATEEQKAAYRVEQNKDVGLPLAGCRVLAAEDHPLNREIVQRLLKKEGIQAEMVKDGKECVERFAASAPESWDLILMDIRMPVMNGLEAAKAIRCLPRQDAREIPIIAMTANAFAEDRELSRQAGMNAHLAKPLDVPTMLKTMRTCLTQYRGNRKKET